MARMNATLELFIGLRYLRAKKRNHFISFISLISIMGIALAIVLLITVLSVMNGFQQELRDRILVMTAHLTVTDRRGEGIADWLSLAESLEGTPGVSGSAPYTRGEVMLSAHGRVNAALLRGVLPERESAVSAVAGKMKAGRLDDLRAGEFGVIIGAELARTIGVGVGDRITVISPQFNASPIGVVPRFKRFTVAGVFEVGMHQSDSALALAHMEDVAVLLRMPGKASGVRFQVDNLFAAPALRERFARELGAGYWVSDWTRQHANFFRAIRTEKTVMFVILSLIVVVAAFNIVSTLVMVVTDKESDIAILRTLGLSPAAILRVFMIQGVFIGVVGVAGGAAGGVALASNLEPIIGAIEEVFETRFLDATVYYISEVPSLVLWQDVALVCAISFCVSALATLYPALRAARTHPAEALRYE